ncbi:hypothetical protein DVH24_002982 [Malus domestica]|uniref:Trichome birefringence-like C-terminal domain-containing protein n=1 Tax=Malus domestica TaxID=3750 RepID=A0A498K9A7_MALDO|nr:hypothetical protein DVH24_002982 [Malus domestica]
MHSLKSSSSRYCGRVKRLGLGGRTLTCSSSKRGIGGIVEDLLNRGQISKDIDRMFAFFKALITWGWLWVTLIHQNLGFFQGRISQARTKGKKLCRAKGAFAWVDLSRRFATSSECAEQCVKHNKKPVTLLDITNLSLLRKDGHPSIYGLGGRTGMDCSHCLIGVFVESQILGMRFPTILFFETLIIEYHKKDGVI